MCLTISARCASSSALQRAEIAEITLLPTLIELATVVSVLFNEPKLLKFLCTPAPPPSPPVSVLFNEPKLLKCAKDGEDVTIPLSFSALQRAEIAEMYTVGSTVPQDVYVSVLFNEPKLLKLPRGLSKPQSRR